jgi:hypothetical protein
MPFNKAEKKENQQNHASFTEEAVTLNKKKAAEYPSNVNGISKNQP